MLAPRKKLWSTPQEVLEKAIELLDIKSTDVVYDVGAGDGRFIIECHQRTGDHSNNFLMYKSVFTFK